MLGTRIASLRAPGGVEEDFGVGKEEVKEVIDTAYENNTYRNHATESASTDRTGYIRVNGDTIDSFQETVPGYLSPHASGSP